MYRFTIRDLLWITAFIGFLLAGFANVRPVAKAMRRWSDALWQEAAQIGPPLMGRDSAPPEIITPPDSMNH